MPDQVRRDEEGEAIHFEKAFGIRADTLLAPGQAAHDLAHARVREEIKAEGGGGLAGPNHVFRDCRLLERTGKLSTYNERMRPGDVTVRHR